jgi:hypothetical protein
MQVFCYFCAFLDDVTVDPVTGYGFCSVKFEDVLCLCRVTITDHWLSMVLPHEKRNLEIRFLSWHERYSTGYLSSINAPNDCISSLLKKKPFTQSRNYLTKWHPSTGALRTTIILYCSYIKKKL